MTLLRESEFVIIFFSNNDTHIPTKICLDFCFFSFKTVTILAINRIITWGNNREILIFSVILLTKRNF